MEAILYQPPKKPRSLVEHLTSLDTPELSISSCTGLQFTSDEPSKQTSPCHLDLTRQLWYCQNKSNSCWKPQLAKTSGTQKKTAQSMKTITLNLGQISSWSKGDIEIRNPTWESRLSFNTKYLSWFCHAVINLKFYEWSWGGTRMFLNLLACLSLN